MHAAIVIPCLNEQDSLASTCASLGFWGSDVRPPVDTSLILVDNGSTDQTATVMSEIQRAAPDRVILANESERGYVPPRHRGALVAFEQAKQNGQSLIDVLVLQADADTRYSPGYVDAVRDAAQAIPGAIVEGVAHAPPDFVAEHPGYHRLAEEVDRVTDRFAVDEADEVIIDDQVAAYRLHDYLAWGGHRREFDRHGDEIHAETSRLFLRGKMMGATRVRVGSAVAFPSRRKVELDPLLYFATQGFPREAGWCQRWRAEQGGSYAFEDFDRPDADSTFAEACFVRQAHSLILFGLMPAYVASLLGRPDGRHVLDTSLGDLATQLIETTAEEIASNPGHLFELLFPLIDSHRPVFKTCIQTAVSQI